MPLVKGNELAKRLKSDGLRETVGHIKGALDEGHLQPSDFSIREIAEGIKGREWVRSLREEGGYHLQEAGDAVSTIAFSNIIGQVLYSQIKQAYDKAPVIGDQLVTTEKVNTLRSEKIPGITQIGDDSEVVNEGKPYPEVGVSQEYIETPESTKRGLIVRVTKEAIIEDKTSLLLQRCSDVGEAIRIKKDKRIVDVALGVTNTYSWNGTAVNTYLASGNWVNIKSSNALEDWTDIDAAEQLFDAMTDPYTGEAIEVMPDTLVVPRALLYTAKRVVSATEIRTSTNSAATETHSANPVQNYNIISAARVKAATSSDSTWFIGNFKKAFGYREVWPLTVVQAPANSPMDFDRDIVTAYKASECGTPYVKEPRYVVKNTG